MIQIPFFFVFLFLFVLVFPIEHGGTVERFSNEPKTRPLEEAHLCVGAAVRGTLTSR
jgi:Na+-transporting methylmalonyl-CoA/oxaloacetate decarboxylase gamma subunit